MFGGLEIKGSSKDDSSTAEAASAFDLASASSPNTTTSAFGFLSSPPADSMNEAPSGGSGFSFLSSSSYLAAQQEESSRALDGVSTASTAGSSFSFLGGLSAIANECEPPSNEAVVESYPNSMTTLPSTLPSMPTSGFSFLSSPSSAISSAGSVNAINELDSNSSNNNNNNNNNSDLLSATNQALPAGAGVSWSAPPISVAGTTAKKVIKKKTGKTRVGVATNAPTQVVPPHSADSLTPPPPFISTTPAFQTMPNIPSTPGSPPLKVKAERAHNSADEFIREKQRSAIAMAAERAMLQKTHSHTDITNVSSDGWKLTNDDAYAASTLAQPPQTSPNDETYRAAKAAAEEARKLETSPAIGGNKAKFSLSGFFHRGRSSGTANGHGGSGVATAGEIGSYSSHGGVVGRAGSATGVNEAALAMPLPPMTEEDAAEDRIQHQNKEDRLAVKEDTTEEVRKQQQREKDILFQKELLERKHREEDEKRRKAEQQRIEQEKQQRLEIETAKRRSPREKMNIILSNFASTTKSCIERDSQLRMQREKLIADRIAAEKTQQYAAQQIAFAESLQTKAAEQEDFEAADRLASVIEKHLQEQQEQIEICKNINEQLDELEKKQNEAVTGMARCFGDVYEKLKELEVEQESKRKEDGKDVLDQFAATSKRLSAETERLNNDLKHIERDEELVAEEQKELEGQISEGTKEFEVKCVEANEKLEEVNKRIEDLRRQLMEAEAEAATLNTELSTHKACIDNVRNKFSRQLGRLEKKQRTVKESRAEWESEKSSLEKEKIAHEAVMEAHSEELLSMDKLIEDIHSELSVAKRFEDIIVQHFGDVSNAGGEDHITSLDSEVLRYEAAAEEANQNIRSAEAAIESLKEEVSLIEARLPFLEKEKKAAAMKRDFKAAGKASKEIKDALARKEHCEAQLADEALARKQVAKKELSNAIAILDEKKSIALERGKELGMKQLTLLQDKIRDLKSILSHLNIVKTDIPDATNVACIGAFVITSRMSVLEANCTALREQYNVCDSKEKSRNDKDEDTAAQNVSATESTSKALCEKKITEAILEKYTSLREEALQLAAALEKAVEEEDYEAAAELDQKLDTARAAIEALNFSPDVLDNEVNGADISNMDDTMRDSPELDPTIDSLCDSNEALIATEGAKSCDHVNETSNDEIEDKKKVSEEGAPGSDESCQLHMHDDSIEKLDCDDVERSI